jgi:signal transduction histidine kinase
MMRILSNLNGIAARIATAIVLAVILIMVMTVGLGLTYDNFFGTRTGARHLFFGPGAFGVINPRRNPAMLAGKIAVIVRTLASSAPAARRGIVAPIAEPEMQVVLKAPLLEAEACLSDSHINLLRQFVQMQLEELSPAIFVRACRPPVHGDQPAGVGDAGSRLTDEARIEAVLLDGERVTFIIPDYPLLAGYGSLLFLFSIFFVAVVVSIWTARRLARPIREFAGAAERLGVDLTAPPLAVRGPRELRTTIAAFNRMQDRLRRFLEDRTQMLAAISHDLRSPLARLRLRAELVTDGEQQQKMFDDLDVMNAMIDSTLAFARDDTRQEPRRLVDLGVLIGDVCEDVADAGGKARYLGPRNVDVPCRPTLIRRAVANLVDNAIKYGGSARVDILRGDERVVIAVDDDGPGIPPQEHEKVFAPFYRIEAARNPGKAGVGLGLSVARTIAREHGGEVIISNRDGGGLSVRVELPVEAVAGASVKLSPRVESEDVLSPTSVG